MPSVFGAKSPKTDLEAELRCLLGHRDFALRRPQWSVKRPRPTACNHPNGCPHRPNPKHSDGFATPSLASCQWLSNKENCQHSTGHTALSLHPFWQVTKWLDIEYLLSSYFSPVNIMLQSLLWPHRLTFFVFYFLLQQVILPLAPSPLWKTLALAQVAQVASPHGKRFGSPAV